MHPLAIASAVCGVLSFPACCCWFYGFPMPIAALICGIMALTKIKANPQAYSGTILCYVGMACGGFSFFMSMAIHMTALGEGIRHRYGRRF